MSQKALADKIGIKQPSLSQLESGESHRTTYISRIATELGVNALWLETGRGPRDAAGAGQSTPSSGSLNLKAETATELQMLLVYRSANEREREAVDDLIDELRLKIEARARDQVKLTG
jgi:transcriptional regulator with XRE-family HTH domain